MPCKICGKECQRGRYLTHLKEFHPQNFLEHQRNATRGLNEKYPTLHKEVMARLLKTSPDHQREAFAKLLEKHPNHQSEAGRIGGKLGGAITGKMTGPRTIWKAIEWKKNHPEEASAILRKFQEAGNRWVREHPEEASEFGRKGARAVHELFASGKVRRNFAFRGKFLWHDEGPSRHFHRSLAEMEKCNELCESIGSILLHPNLYFKGIELDWVVSKVPGRFDKDNPLTWNEVIEYHPVIRTWSGETSRQDYQDKRIDQIRSRGVTCEVRFI
jgi:hypothetical protein